MARLLETRLPMASGLVSPETYNRMVRILEINLNRFDPTATPEYTETDNFIPMLEGRSSVGRLGLFVHITAGFGDIGFKGYWTLEIFCVQPVKIYPGVEICQIFYHSIDGDYDSYEGGKYQGNKDIQTSMLYKDFDKK